MNNVTQFIPTAVFTMGGTKLNSFGTITLNVLKKKKLLFKNAQELSSFHLITSKANKSC
jgi:hypothetical protein